MNIQKFLQKANNPLVSVIGATASGKTGISLRIAAKFDGEIVSTDSRQIYRGMDIATDVLADGQRQGIMHHMIGIAQPDQVISLSEFADMAQAKIEEIRARGKLPILVGGTGLYINAITQAYKVPRIPADPEFRARQEQIAREKGKEHLHQILQKVDPESAEKIHPNNVRYVIRALEIYEKSGRKKSDQKSEPHYDSYFIGIKWPREKLYQRIEERVDQQIERGLVDEVKELLKKYDPTLPSMSSLGVKEIIPFLKGEVDLDTAVNQLKQNTRNYAKRQLTWFRKYDNVNWLTPSEAENFLKD